MVIDERLCFLFGEIGIGNVSHYCENIFDSVDLVLLPYELVSVM